MLTFELVYINTLKHLLNEEQTNAKKTTSDATGESHWAASYVQL